jgi:hypothetical protein
MPRRKVSAYALGWALAVGFAQNPYEVVPGMK